MKKQPIDSVVWHDRNSLKPNDYNPNRQFKPEHELLILSILENGWTQPIVVHEETKIIIDGEHRWRASGDDRLKKVYGDMVPVVMIKVSRIKAQYATIRHNRARGVHGVRPMAEIVAEMLKANVSVKEIQKQLGMEVEEIMRLAEDRGLPIKVGTEHTLSQARIPVKWTPYRAKT